MTDSQLQACDRCHRRKTKCDKTRPNCVACARANAACVYSTRTKEPLYRRDVVERLEKRAQQLEMNNRALREQLASVTRHSEAPPNIAAEPNAARGSTAARNDVANEVSFLSTHAGGDRQFLGPASGLFLAGLVKASAQQHVDRSGVASPDDGTFTQSNWSTDNHTLPPRQLAQNLVDAYLAHDALCYPILHPKSVLATVDAVYSDPAHYRNNAFNAFTFDMLLAIATAQVYKFNWQVLPDAETHHQRAMVHLDTVLSEGGIRALQAMLLCCQFRLSSSTKDASGSLWHLVGIATRICFELGLHRESSYPFKDPDQHATAQATLSPFEVQEVRRRCFWCVFALDRVVSITLGRPLAIHAEDIDVELPSASGTEDQSPFDESGSNPDLSSRIAPSYRTAIFVHIVRYRALCGKILTLLHRGSRGNTPPDAQFRQMRSQLAHELESWRADTAGLKLPDMDLSAPLAEARSSFRSKAWYELLYQNGALLLYRPSPATNISESSDEDDSVQRIHAAAKQSVTLYAYLFRSRKINFSWITLHAVFLAGLSYVYAVSRHFREKRRQRVSDFSGNTASMLTHDPSIIEIVNDTRACSNVLVAVTERCNVPKNCHEVFDRLSDAVLADAVELYTGSKPAPDDRHSSSSYGATHVNYASGNASASATDPMLLHASSTTYIPPRTYVPQEPPLAVDSALRDCLPELQHIYDASWGDDAILQLSMDWLDGLGTDNDFMMAPFDMQPPFNG